MTKQIETVSFDTPRRAKGRGGFNADAIVVERDEAGNVYLCARVASTGNLNHCWMSLPPKQARRLATVLVYASTEDAA